MSLLQDNTISFTSSSEGSDESEMTKNVLPNNSLEEIFLILAKSSEFKVLNDDRHIEAYFKKEFGTLYVTLTKSTSNLLVWSIGAKGYREYSSSSSASKVDLMKGFAAINELK